MDGQIPEGGTISPLRQGRIIFFLVGDGLREGGIRGRTLDFALDQLSYSILRSKSSVPSRPSVILSDCLPEWRTRTGQDGTRRG